jgi:hypothetical protein
MQTERFISVPEPTGKNDTRAGITMDPLQLGLGLGATLGIAPVDRAHYS